MIPFSRCSLHGVYRGISSVVEKHEWGIFYLYPNDFFLKVVKEFYAYITSLDNAFVYVHGASVPFDKDSINAQYGLFEGPDEHADFVKTMSRECLTQLILRNDCYTVDRVLLKPQCKICYHFLKTCLIHSAHNATISNDRLLLVLFIMVGQKINVGNIVFLEIYFCAQNNVGTLNFPSLITALCQRVKVPLSPNEDHLPNKRGYYYAHYTENGWRGNAKANWHTSIFSS
ncbi:hypothetical protein V6Z11_D10G170500 [Gossypium hirsutum]